MYNVMLLAANFSPLFNLPSPSSAVLSMLEEHPPSKKGVGKTENHQERLRVTVNLNTHIHTHTQQKYKIKFCSRLPNLCSADNIEK